MPKRFIHLELLIGKKVTDNQGAPVGRIEEVHARTENAQTLVTEYVLGEEGLMQRLSISGVSMFFLRLLGAARSLAKSSQHVPWHLMDLSDPQSPKLRCRKDQLTL